MAIVSWEMQGSVMGMQTHWKLEPHLKVLSSYDVTVLFSYEIQSSVMGNAGLIGNLGLTSRC
jgi:hypothetical protein